MTDLFRAIAEFTYDWESWIDPDGRTAWVNPAVERMTGYSVEECRRMRRYPLSIIAPEDRERMAKALDGARLGTSGNDVEFRIVRKDGSRRWLAISWQPLLLRGKKHGYRTSVRDIDDRKKAAEALVEAKQRAEAADRAKSEFLAVMSHEIRSPLQVVNGYSQLLARTPLTPKQASYVEPMKRENEALLRIVGDVLDFSSLQSGRLELDETVFDPRDVIDGVVEAAAPRAQEKKLRVRATTSASVPHAVVGDPYRIRQVLRNIVDNAVKFTATGSVVIRASARGDRLVVRVRDTGVGIPKSRYGRIFEMFSQADASTSRRYGGSGLGLAICRRLCERMGGSVDVGPGTNGKGTTFTVRLPLRLPIASASPAVPPTPLAIDRTFAAHVPLRILVVDDSAIARDVAVALLAELGYAADRAASGRAALALTKKRPYDLVLLDMHMPGLDGLETARQLRRRRRPPRVVALTADVFVRDAEELDAVLTKPLELRTLAAFLAREAPIDPEVRADLASRALLAPFLRRFRSDGRRLVRTIGQAVRDGDEARIAAGTHELAGLALSFGARPGAGLPRAPACRSRAAVRGGGAEPPGGRGRTSPCRKIPRVISSWQGVAVEPTILMEV